MGNLSPFPSTRAPAESSPVKVDGLREIWESDKLLTASLAPKHQRTPQTCPNFDLGPGWCPWTEKKVRPEETTVGSESVSKSVRNRFGIGSESVRKPFEIRSESARNRSRVPFRPFRFEIGSKSVPNRFPQINRVSIWQPIFYRFCTDSGSIFNPPRTPSEHEAAPSQCWQSLYYQPSRPSTTTPKSQALHNRDTKRATKTPTTNML